MLNERPRSKMSTCTNGRGGVLILILSLFGASCASGPNFVRPETAAGRQRMRPILLTTLTTIGGLLPLSLFGGALFAPMTNGMIFGLAFSTVLTLIVVPTMYLVFVERLGMKVGAR